MGRKSIFINENKLDVLGNKKYLLPKFLFTQLQTHHTSLGKNPAFPPDRDNDFDYSVIKKRYKEIVDNIVDEFGEEMLTVELAESTISSLLRHCKRLEQSIRPQLEKVAYNAINRLFAIPTEVINYSCTLVDKVKFDNAIRITPESDTDENKYEFDDIRDILQSSKAIAKRRVINSLIQGGTSELGNITETYADEIQQLNGELLPLYKQIMILSDYLLFVKKEKMTDKNPQQGAFVSVILGKQGEKTSIDAQGIIFPLMYNELIRGFLEQFSSFGLPQDAKKMNYIIKKADFILAEPWDMRFGSYLWKHLMPENIDTNAIPYYFKEICQMPIDDFNIHMQEVFASTKQGKMFKHQLLSDVQHNVDYNHFINDLQAKNVDKSLINDGYFSAAELDSFMLDGEGDIPKEEILTDEVDKEENTSLDENQEAETLDNTYMQPLYNYLKNGEKYSSTGYFHASERMLESFFRYLTMHGKQEDVVTVAKALKKNPQLKGKVRIVNTQHGPQLRCYSQMSTGLEEVKPYDFLHQNSKRIFNIIYNDVDIAPIFDKFMFFINSNAGNLFFKRRQNLEADTVLMNPEFKNTQWLIHFTEKEENAIDIWKHGFKFGLTTNHMKQLGYTNSNIPKSTKTGKYAYAYNAQEIADNFFPCNLMVQDEEDWEFNEKFDQKAWENGLNYAIMFQSNGVEVHHGTDKQQQVIFNTDMARNFVLLSFTWAQSKEADPRDTRAYHGDLKGNLIWNVIGKTGQILYYNTSLTNVVRWVINNYDQYRKQL